MIWRRECKNKRTTRNSERIFFLQKKDGKGGEQGFGGNGDMYKKRIGGGGG